MLPYFVSLGRAEGEISEREALTTAFERIEAHEATILKPLIDFLVSKYNRGVRIVGTSRTDSRRAPTVSFVVVGADGNTKRLQSKWIVDQVDATNSVRHDSYSISAASS